MPLDLAPDPAGLLLVNGRRVEFAEHAPADWPDGPRRTSHFATCPNAAVHRGTSSTPKQETVA